MVHRRIAAAVVASVALVACGGDDDLAQRVDVAAARVQALEDDVADLRDEITTTTATPATPIPLSTVTAPPTVATTPPPTVAETTTTVEEQELPPAASEEEILAIVGTGSWDPELPLPRSCLGSATFEPRGDNGTNGGTLRCTASEDAGLVGAFYRIELANRRFRFTQAASGNSIVFRIGSQATITVTGAGAGTDIVMEQIF